jgi:hypothetical protein
MIRVSSEHISWAVAQRFAYRQYGNLGAEVSCSAAIALKHDRVEVTAGRGNLRDYLVSARISQHYPSSHHCDYQQSQEEGDNPSKNLPNAVHVCEAANT